jgi:hypothetical protein
MTMIAYGWANSAGAARLPAASEAVTTVETGPKRAA